MNPSSELGNTEMIHEEEWPNTYEDQFRDYYDNRIDQEPELVLDDDEEDWMVD